MCKPYYAAPKERYPTGITLCPDYIDQLYAIYLWGLLDGDYDMALFSLHFISREDLCQNAAKPT